MIKTYTNPQNTVKYGYSRLARKWVFQIESIKYNFIVPCRGNIELGAKIANILHGSVLRNGTVDGLARANIARIVG